MSAVEAPAETTRTAAAIGTGRRKTSVARVRIRAGSGKITVNKRSFEEFFLVEFDRQAVLAPLDDSGHRESVDVVIRVNGGGTTGQAGAVKLGLARALVKATPETEVALRDNGLLTRDARKVERKKYGRRGARRSFQFSKR